MASALTPGRVRFALLALALGGFGIGCTEFVIIGLLPTVAADLLPGVYAASTEQANAQAGWLISAYALGVVVGAPTIVPFVARFSRKRLLLVFAAWFVFATLLSAVLPTFGLVLVARFLAALPHGAYFGVAALVAAELMGPGNRGRGTAYVLGGLTIANVIGVPAITWLGQNASWRIAYLAVAAVFALTLIMVALAVPPMAGNPAATVRGELKAFARPQVWFALATGAIGFGGLFAAYTYVAPLATTVTGIDAALVPIVLIVFGAGMTVGNLFGGWFVDRGVKRAVLVFFVAIIVSLAFLLVVAANPVGLFIGVFFIGASAAALSPAIQVRLMDVAGDSQTIAAAVNHSALNLGNSLGAFLGGLTIAAGLGYTSPIAAGIVLSILGIAVALISFGVERRGGGRLQLHGEPLTEAIDAPQS
ncbi:MFS transporter [Naasia lichenicola]|uniref:MFS transporter n=1 Tax=Naasia lichenicola TaxID=2565933 RepID=A0A4S4FF38_9MICO|nr:MFS transporter [Naasia lichenicola]